MRRSIVALVLAAGTALALAQTDRAIQYEWGFPHGNLVTNWSFENEDDEACTSVSNSDVDVDCHFPFTSAPSGSRAMLATLIASSSSATVYAHRTDFLRVESGKDYFLSVNANMLFGSATALGKIRPSVEFFDEGKQSLGAIPLEFYGLQMNGTIGEWQSYSKAFSSPATAAFVRVSLVSFTQTEDCALLFDNFLVSPQADPAFIETRTYSDAGGNVEKEVFRDATNDVVRFTTYDTQRRPVRHYAPVFGGTYLPPGGLGGTQLPIFTVGAGSPPNAAVQDFATLDGAYAALVAWAGAHTASQIAQQDLRIVTVVNPNDPFVEISADVNTVRSGDPVPVEMEFTIDGIYRGSLEHLNLLASVAPHPTPAPPPPASIPSAFDDPEAVVNAGTFAQNYPGESHFFSEMSYPDPGANTFSESALPGNGYALAQGKTDKRGWAFVPNTALLNNATPSVSDLEIASSTLSETDPEPYLYQWSHDRQGNYSVSFTGPKGLVEKEAVQKNGGWKVTSYAYDGFNRLYSTTSPEGKQIQVTAYDGQSHEVEVVDPDRGTVQSIYDDRNRLRFTKSTANSYFRAIRYDLMGRAVGVAKVLNSNDFTQINADNPVYPAISALEQGSVYDELTDVSFNARTGLQPADIGLDLAWLKNTQGKVAMVYKRNQEASVSGLSSVDKLVACFYAYDERGRLGSRYEYLGPAPVGHRWHKIEDLYDEQDRLQRRIVYKDAGSAIAQAVSYQYDARGRVSKIVDETGASPVDATVYTYNPLDQTTAISHYQAIQMTYGYDIQGKSLSIEGDAGGKNVFAEYLGYEGLAHPQLPGSTPAALARFDGKIGSALLKYSLNALGNGAQPIEYKTFDYRMDGSLSETNRYSSSALNPGTGEVDFSQLAFGSTPTQTLDYTYRDDGGFSGQSIDNAAGNDISQTYTYPSGTHQLSAVTRTDGTISTTSAFTYDGEGRLTGQSGPNARALNYDFMGMPVDISAGGVKQHYFYGPDNFRVATYTENLSTSTITEKKVYVYEEGLKVAKEIRDNGSSIKTRVHLYGQGNEPVGVMDEETGAKRFLVKDHLGSVSQVVDENGNPQDETFFADYGDLTKKVGSGDILNPSEGWTGKEYDAQMALLYFGKRFYDPMLGFWLTTDPASQFFNPYAYHRNPVSYVDPDGEFFWLFLAALAGAGFGALQGYQAHASGWGMVGYVAGGAVIGFTAGVAVQALAPLVTTAASAIATNFGLSTGAAAFAGNFTSGVVTGVTANTITYSEYYALGKVLGNPNIKPGMFWPGFRNAALFGGVLGGAVGAVLGGFQWATDAFKGAAMTVEADATMSPSGLEPRFTVQENVGPAAERGAAKISSKIAKQMPSRGWTEKSIDEAIQAGKQFKAVNKATGNTATRYVHPVTGQSVVVDDVTGEVIHVGGLGFIYGAGSGDVSP